MCIFSSGSGKQCNKMYYYGSKRGAGTFMDEDYDTDDYDDDGNNNGKNYHDKDNHNKE